jgi:hypothetical protein
MQVYRGPEREQKQREFARPLLIARGMDIDIGIDNVPGQSGLALKEIDQVRTTHGANACRQLFPEYHEIERDLDRFGLGTGAQHATRLVDLGLMQAQILLDRSFSFRTVWLWGIRNRAFTHA